MQQIYINNFATYCMLLQLNTSHDWVRYVLFYNRKGYLQPIMPPKLLYSSVQSLFKVRNGSPEDLFSV